MAPRTLNRKRKVKVRSLSHVRLFATPWTVAHQAPPSSGFSRQEYWSGLSFPSPGDLPDPGIDPRCSALQADALTSEPPGKLVRTNTVWLHLYEVHRRVKFIVRRPPWRPSGIESAHQWSGPGFNPWVRKMPWRRKWQPIPVFLPRKSHGWRNLAGYSWWSCRRVGYYLATEQQQ